MNRTNMDFLIAALILLMLVLYHFRSENRLQSANSRIFGFFICLGAVDIVFDILCTLLIERQDPSLNGLLKPALTVFYLMQVLIPYALLCYVQTLRDCSPAKKKRVMVFWSLPSAALGILVLWNYRSGWFFGFDRAGRYFEGPGYLTMYYYAMAYAALVAVFSLIYHRELGPKKFRVTWEFLLIEGICVAIQAYSDSLLTIGFGIGMGILVLYLSINNPSSYMDHMTGVFDKQYFSRWMEEQFGGGRKFHVISVDLFQLKQVNSLFGANAGDLLLARVAGELQEQGERMHLFRLSGNRFIMLTYTLTDYEKNRDRIRAYFAGRQEVKGEQILFPAVICGITNAEKLEDADTLQSYLEYMVSLAPDSEESILIQDNAQTREGFRYEREVERFLNTAIADDLFEVAYQPVYSAAEKEFVSLEALSRLRHPTLGMVSPEIFITLAEKNGQITRIGQMQFRRICRFVREHEELLDKIKSIKFNLSPAELMKKGYSEQLIATIREFSLPFSFFQFEITETVATEYSENLRRAVEDFRNVGIGLCLDDFGSGYANLNTVLKLPFTCIKLDRSLLSGICEDEQIASFYRSMVSILQDMGFDVVAEGVETEEEMEKLKDWHVGLIQGYYFSPPVSGEKILDLL